MTDFSDALDRLKLGAKMERAGWNGRGMYVYLVTPMAHQTDQLPFLMMRTAHGKKVPWLASQTDLLAEDWIEVD